MIRIVENKGDSPLYWASAAIWIATVLEGLFRDYHSSSTALGQQRPEVTKQPLVRDWLPTTETLMMLNRHHSNYKGKFVQGWIKYSKDTWLDYSQWGLCTYISAANVRRSGVKEKETSGCCWPSAADEEWYSLKRPSSTVTIQLSSGSSVQRWAAFIFV